MIDPDFSDEAFGLPADDVVDIEDFDEAFADEDGLGGAGTGVNPLADLLGGGGMPDLGSMLDGLSAVQSIQAASYTGTAGGGLVRIVASGRMDVESVTISADALGDDADAELVADLVLAALRDLTAQIADAQKQAMGPLGDILGQ
jgi:DNA-binding protein YbaB